MQHYLVPSIENNLVQFAPDDVHHIVNVMRARSGDEVIVIHHHCAYLATLVVEGKHVHGTVVRIIRQAEKNRQVTLIYGLPKADKWEWVLQKATELGVNRIIPYQADKSVVHIDVKTEVTKHERWMKIVKEAVEQSERLTVPVIEPIRRSLAFSDIQAPIKLFAYERTTTSEPLHRSFGRPTDDLVLVVGPEAGWSTKEAAYFQANQFTTISLGDTILRSETAALYVLAIAKFLGETHD